MNAIIIDGKAIALDLRNKIKKIVDDLRLEGHPPPGLATLQIGNNPASEIYVKNKILACEAAGFYSHPLYLPETCSQKEVIETIQSLNDNKAIHGILLQLPLPAHLDADAILETIAIEKDVDGFHPYNLGRLAQKRPLLRPCTPYGIMLLLKAMQISVRGKDCVIVGASNIVGRPMALELLLAGGTVTVCHSRTENLASHIQRAEILIAALGKPGIIKSEWIKQGATVLDVGITRHIDGKLSGDIDFESAKERAAFITPVPGGVGPMTIAALLNNTLMASGSAYFSP